MSKFGELIDGEKPILLVFYEGVENDGIHRILNDVAAAVGDKGKVIKLDISKNPKLVEALRVKAAPTFTIYKSSEMVWRQNGEQDANTLIGLVSEYLD
ncbi:MAG: thioredoxin [Flavobacteriaceae bacterium TMED206]|nr:MAG: thioredoxin [Flavobacteriaceae bacterium TMED206]|tara:strand:- start:260 stop:553 length:294 start_codon:yes stop_codon:yes gene_type:complete